MCHTGWNPPWMWKCGDRGLLNTLADRARRRFGGDFDREPLRRISRCAGEATPAAGSLLGRLAERAIWCIDRYLPRVEAAWKVRWHEDPHPKALWFDAAAAI